jgi:thiol-disulfide isomerase/thioredoxin
MPITHRHLLKIFLLLLISSVCMYAQKQTPGVRVSNDDPKWGEEINVSYTMSDTSSFASRIGHDTLFCAAIFNTYSGERGVVMPMKPLQKGLYQTSLRIPDSIFSLRIEICTPNEQAPDGTTDFTCRTADGGRPPWTMFDIRENYDSSFTQDIIHYPTHYTSYLAAFDELSTFVGKGQITMSDSAMHEYLLSLIARLKAQELRTPAWYLALSELYGRLRGGDSASQAYLRRFSESAAFDPIYNEHNFWIHYFYPLVGKDGKVSYQDDKERLLTSLVVRFPKTDMAQTWLKWASYDTLMDTNAFHYVSEQWSSSQSAYLLLIIADAYIYKMCPLYDPTTALRWYNKAEESIRTKAGFYSGEDIYGGIWEKEGVIKGKAKALIALGRAEEAVSQLEHGIAASKIDYARTGLRKVLAQAYITLGKFEDAQREYGILLASGMHGMPDGLDELYKKCKQGDETENAFATRLADKYRNAVTLPILQDFSYTTLEGKSGSLKKLHGKVVVLDFWFINCPGCAAEKQSLNRLVDHFKGDTDVVFLSVALDSKPVLQQYLQTHESGFFIVPSGSAICDAAGINAYPTHAILGRDGKTFRWDTGGGENAGDMMISAVQEALAQK